jgi:hypothetical protein
MSAIHGNSPKKRVAVVIPFQNRNFFTHSEQISLKHLDTYLYKYDRYLLVPKGLNLFREGYYVRHFPVKYFGSINAHIRMLFSKYLYESFNDYEYILIYHLDSLVFSDQMLYWCDLGYDYIGAPWILCDDLPKRTKEGVGNGGFSIRKVDSFLKVLNSKERWVNKEDIVSYYNKKTNLRYRLKNYVSFKMLRLPFNNTVERHVKYRIKFNVSSDSFWEEYGQYYYSEFKVAPVDVALRFAIECAPRTCFERNGKVLPFGCHAWERFDKEFWEPYVLNGK